MGPHFYSHEQLINFAQFSSKDIEQVNQRRRQYNRLGFGYQLAFVRLVNRFPYQNPFEIIKEISRFVSIQLNIPSENITAYAQRRQTIDEHRDSIRTYLGIKRFGEKELPVVERFIFEEACRLEQTNALLARVEQFLKEKKILKPSGDTLQRLIGAQRKEARNFIFTKISNSLSKEFQKQLELLIDVQDKRQSPLHELKQAPGRPAPGAIIKLTKKLEKIEATGILKVDLTWLNNNYQRSLSRYVRRTTATKLRRLQDDQRYAVLVCFLWQIYGDTVDYLVDMFDKLINKIYNHAQTDVDNHNKSQRKNIQESLKTYHELIELIFNESIDETNFRQTIFKKIGKEVLFLQRKTVRTWLTGKHSHVFNLVKARFSYIRQFSPSLLRHIQLRFEDTENSSLSKAVSILREMNNDNKRKLPDDVPVDFIPKKIRGLIEMADGKVNKAAWECALLTAVRDEIKSGNISIARSKRFGRLDDFFISEDNWAATRKQFFERAALPSEPGEVREYLTERLNIAFDTFLDHLPENTYAKVEADGWHLSADSKEQLDVESKKQLGVLKAWLSKHMRTVKLPELLIEVDNELKITRHFMAINQQEDPKVEDICAVLATIMAHGCNIGTYTMAQLIDGVKL